MATTFPQDTYELSDRTRFISDNVTKRDVLDDGAPRVRILSTSTYKIVRCVFSNMTSANAISLENYVAANLDTEFDMVFSFTTPDSTYRGYFWSDPVKTPREGDLYTVTVDFRGVEV